MTFHDLCQIPWLSGTGKCTVKFCNFPRSAGTLENAHSTDVSPELTLDIQYFLRTAPWHHYNLSHLSVTDRTFFRIKVQKTQYILPPKWFTNIKCFHNFPDLNFLTFPNGNLIPIPQSFQIFHISGQPVLELTLSSRLARVSPPTILTSLVEFSFCNTTRNLWYSESLDFFVLRWLYVPVLIFHISSKIHVERRRRGNFILPNKQRNNNHTDST